MAAVATKPITRLNDLSHGKLDGPKLDPRAIHIRPGFNMREMQSQRVLDHIVWLKSTMLENIKTDRDALDTPLQVEWSNKTAHLVNGECRLVALQQLCNEGHAVYATVNQVKGNLKDNEADILAISLRTNGGLPPTQMEFGERAKRLVELGWSVDRVCALAPPHLSNDKMRKMWVNQSLELQQAPAEVKQLVKEGVDGVEVSSAAALSEVRADKKRTAEPGTTAAQRLTQKAVEAKSTGKKTVKREKTDGKVSAQRKGELSALEIGDKLAALCIAEHPDWDDIDKCARRYIRQRK